MQRLIKLEVAEPLVGYTVKGPETMCKSFPCLAKLLSIFVYPQFHTQRYEISRGLEVV